MINNGYEGLKIKVTLKMSLWYLLTRSIGKGLNITPGSMKFLRYSTLAINYLQHLISIERDRKHYMDLLELNSSDPQKFGSGYGITDEFSEIRTASFYRKQLKSGDIEKKKSESAALYKDIKDKLALLMSEDKTINSIVDFGVSYGHIVSSIATMYPNVNVFGIDRSKLTTYYNQSFFDKIRNLTFIADDIYNFLSKQSFDNGIFLHMRTLTLLSPSFIERLYENVANAGFKYIVGAEQCGISRQTNEPYVFSDEKKDSVLFRNHMFIHNYPAFLRQAGFRVKEIDLLKTNHTDPDYRLIVFISKLI